MSAEQHQQEIKELFLSKYKVTHKVSDRIELFQTLIDLAEKYSLPAYAACFRGYLAWLKKEYDQALSHFQESTQIDKSLPYPWYGIGNVYVCLEQNDQALKSYEKAIELDENYVYPWNGLGNVYYDLKQNDQALKCYEKAIELDETYAYPWNGLGNVYSDLKQNDQALKCYKKAIELDENCAHPWYGLGNVYSEEKKYEQSLKCYEKAIELDETDAYPWNGLGNMFFDLKEYVKAKEHYEKAIKLEMSLPAPWNGLANIYAELKEYDKAKEYYEKVIELDPNEPHGKFNLGLLLFEQRKYSEAKALLQIAQAGYQKIEYKNEYWIARTQELLSEIKKRQDSEKYAAQVEQSSPPMMKVLRDTMAMKLAEEAEENQRSFRQFLDEPLDHEKDVSEEYLLVLRRWNSYTPIVADDFHIGKGGGYFLKVKGKGIVIDPGFNFIDNFRVTRGLFHEIDAVLVSHAHNDHTADLESILTLLEEYNEEIKDSSDPTKKTTIRRELAENKKPPVAPKDIAQEEIDQVFLKSPRRKIIDFYLTVSVFKKYGGLFDLFSKNNYCLHIVEPKDSKDLFGGVRKGGVRIEFLKAKHNDIISDRNSVGLYIEFSDLILIYSGDTGWNHEIEQQYKVLGRKFARKYRLLLAHLGGVKEKEESFFSKQNQEAFYENHLGRLGLVRINEVLQPQVCIISEFGEELRERRQDLANIYRDAFEQKIAFIPGDINLKFDLKTRKVWAITKIDRGELSEDYIDPKLVSSELLRKDYSLHYFDSKAKINTCHLVQIRRDKLDKNQQ